MNQLVASIFLNKERKINMQKFISILLAAVFASVTVGAIASDAPAKKDEKAAAKAEAKADAKAPAKAAEKKAEAKGDKK